MTPGARDEGGAPPWLSYGSLAISMFVVGACVALSKPLAAVFSVFLLGWLRFGIGLVGMQHWLRRPTTESPLSSRLHLLMFLEAFIGSFLFTVFMVLGVSLSGAVAAGVVMSAIPATIAVLSRLVLREAIRPRVLAAIACAVTGIALLALVGPDESGAGQSEASGRGPWLGYVLLGGAVLCEACYAVIGKRLTAVLSSRRISALMNLWGFVLMLPAGVYVAWSFDFRGVAGPIWGLLAFYGLASSWTIWLWMTGLRRVPASRAGVFTVMLPVGSACVGVWMLDEPFGLSRALAFALALAGLLLAAWPARSSQRTSRPPSL
ncbi:MAG: DMT family transporter [Castellaniella sp.]|uniref:DMT family transporter n=1 Tax=Castellaniella sp. TaxID=1955812 RepID=UPI003A8BB979